MGGARASPYRAYPSAHHQAKGPRAPIFLPDGAGAEGTSLHSPGPPPPRPPSNFLTSTTRPSHTPRTPQPPSRSTRWHRARSGFLTSSPPTPRLLAQVHIPEWSHITFPGASMLFLVCIPLTLCPTYNEKDELNQLLVIFHPMSDNFEPNQLSRVVAPHCGAMRWAISNFPKNGIHNTNQG